ncbi:MAG: hypothetical protein J6B80_05915 [Clostridia bacterium]|nr:hypothetical protein [Clostridia bacterium]
MPIEANNKCFKCGDRNAEKYVWCDKQHDFICFDCHTKCEHYDGNCFMRGADCKLKYNTDNRQIYVFTANRDEVAAARPTYKNLTLKQLEERFDGIHTSYLESNDGQHKAAYRVHLAAIYLEIQDRQNAYVCIHNSN